MSGTRRRAPSTVILGAVLGGIAVLATLLLLAPTVVVIVVSFTDGYSLKFPPPPSTRRVSPWRGSTSTTAPTRL